MKKLKRAITYLICMIILLWIPHGTYALNSEKNYNIITAQLVQNKYSITSEIEKLFRQNLNLGNHVKYTKVPRGLIVSINSSVFFDDGGDEIKEQSKHILDKIGDLIKYIDKQCVIEGNTERHTFEKSAYNSNWEISIVRAEKIADYLIKIKQIDPQKIRAIGFGEMMPFAQSVDYDKDMNNHRIDFVILNYEIVTTQ